MIHFLVFALLLFQQPSIVVKHHASCTSQPFALVGSVVCGYGAVTLNAPGTGMTIIAGVADNDGTSTVSDPTNGSYTALPAGSTTPRSKLLYFANATGNSSLTLTIADSYYGGAYNAICAAAFSGCNGAYDATAGVSNVCSSSPLTVGPLTPSLNVHNLFVTLDASTATEANMTINSGFSTPVYGTRVFWEPFFSYLVQNNNTAQSPSWSKSPLFLGTNCATMAVFNGK
jgi:hypothetical protein